MCSPPWRFCALIWAVKNTILSLLLLLSFALSAAAAAPRNVVLFIADDMGQDAGCYGNRDVKTPHLDVFARESTLYRRAFCTTASCSASRSVILSGLHNHANGHYGHQHAFHNFHAFPSVQSLPVLLTRHGYRTARVGKFHVQPESVYQFGKVIPGGGWNGLAMADACREFVTDKSQPFFLYFCPLTPHRSGGVLPGHPLKPNAFGNHQPMAGHTDVKYDEKSLAVPPHLPDTPACRAELAQYYQAITRVDASFGRLVQLLKETGQYENTLIIFASDNGMAWPGAKTTLYEPGMRLPLVVRSPDQKKRGVASDAMVSWVDITPTILDFAGVKEVLAPPLVASGEESGKAAKKKSGEVPYSFHGRSFAPTLDGGAVPGWEVVFGSHQFHEITMYYPMRCIRTGRYKLILNLAHPLPYPFASDLHESATWQDFLKSGASRYGKRPVQDYLQRPRYELYDLQNDPDEVSNLAQSAAHKAMFTELAERLKNFQERTRDPWISKYIYE